MEKLTWPIVLVVVRRFVAPALLGAVLTLGVTLGVVDPHLVEQCGVGEVSKPSGSN